MSEIFILQNQDKQLLGKQKDWLDGRDPGSLFKTAYKDEAINQMVEISAKDYTQRIKVLSCPVNEKGFPVIAEELLPPPQPRAPKKSAPLFEQEAQAGDDGESPDLTDSENESSADPQAALR